MGQPASCTRLFKLLVIIELAGIRRINAPAKGLKNLFAARAEGPDVGQVEDEAVV